ncbi:unnamed protein product [Somion occarium]|uniref:P-loop containing nucleoside triphosphate hydrolase protein n=1 Tax=Somion occarium TaxID=3059160 RepID=A0ABP1CPV2_9APHY
MAKKKKTQLKPVARGFATTSVPKKAVEPLPEPEKSTEDVCEGPSNAPAEATSSTVGTPTQPKLEDVDLSKSKTQPLQDLVDRYQDRVEKEIVRTVKAIEQERRFSSTLTDLSLDTILIDQILALVLDEESRNSEKNQATLEEPEEKALQRLAITYGVLRRLGFTEDRVIECLRRISGVDLDEATEWLHVHCSEDELGLKPPSPGADLEPSTSTSTSRITQPNQRMNRRHTSCASTQISTSPPTTPTTPNGHRFRLDVNAATPLEPPAFEEDRTSTSSSGASLDLPYDDPTTAYVKVKMQIADLTTHRRVGAPRHDVSFLQELRKRLEEIKNDYLFDEREAEDAYLTERKKVDTAALQSRLRGEMPSLPTEKPPSKPPLTQSLPSTPPPGSPDIFDAEEDEASAGGIFGLLEAMPDSEISETGSTIIVRDMSLPKHFSGRTPKHLLQESVHKSDRFAVISYRCASGSSRAKRAAVFIRWGGDRVKEWVMEDIACHDMFQAEHYISTVALHSITFPSLEGFSLGGTTAASTQTSFRLLPPIFRDLWNELEEERRADDDAFNRNVWAKLKELLQLKLRVDMESGPRAPRQTSDVKETTGYRRYGQTELTSEQIAAGFNARWESPGYQEMLPQRNKLPIALYRNEIINVLETSQILVLSGETGCGKSTQLPTFILEDQLSRGKHCKIYCTEPRRISAISLAQRVSAELGEPAGSVGTVGSLVGYSIRLESNTSRTTRLAFVTNGIALRMLEGGSGQDGQGTAFDEITHIIIDEVHERTIESDFLLIVLKSLLQQRPDLKVVLMSATVDAQKISNYFGGCPMLLVPGRTFPVDVRYLEDAIEFAEWKITENSPYARRGDKYSRGKLKFDWSEDTAPADDDDEETAQDNVKLEKRYSSSTANTLNLLDERLVPYDLIVRLLEKICLEGSSYTTYSSAILVFMPGMGEIRRLNDVLLEHAIFGSEALFKIFPLHSTISSEQQGAVFDIPPPGIRKIVIATNIAETGITIPDITCVIDSGKHKEMRFDEKRQISRLVETFVAKSNAAQRRGRAGRVQPGLCFHLFTKVRHDTKMADHPDPEMMRLSLSDLALRIKIMKVKLGSSIEDVLSRALDPPLSVNIQRAVSALVEVRALTPSEDITPMGRLLSKLPTDVHLGKFLLIASVFRCLDPALTIAATLNSKSPFVAPFGLADEAHRAKLSFRTENSDFLTIHNAFSTWRNACNNGVARKLCRQSYLSHQNLQQIEELRQQFLGYLVDSNFLQVDKAFVRELSRTRYSRGRPRFVLVPPEYDRNSNNVFMVNAALVAGLYPKVLAVDPARGEMRTITNNQTASFHPSSVNFHRRPKDFGVNHLSYFTLMQSKKLYAWETGPVDDLALLLLCGEAEFKLMADTVLIDRKVKFRIEPKASVALKFLRNQLGQLLATQFRAKPLTESQVLWSEMAMKVLGKVKPKDPDAKQETVTVVVNRPT